MDQETRAVVFKVVLDVVCLVIVAFPILIFYVAGTPYERGFFCNDESLRHPFKDSTVPSWSLYIFGLGLPIAAIIITEYYLRKNPKNNALTILKYTIPSWWQEVYKHVGVFGFGAAVSQLLTDIGKYTIGRLRPHFYDVCSPDVDCRDPNLQNVYITWFKCRGMNNKLIKDMRLSFPSGHSSFSMYCMLFLVMYLQAKLTWNGSKLLKHVIQYFALILAIFTALSRISDYKHHWSDVLSGVVLGIIVAIVVVVFVSDLFPVNQPSFHATSVEEAEKETPIEHVPSLERIPSAERISSDPKNEGGSAEILQNSVTNKLTEGGNVAP